MVHRHVIVYVLTIYIGCDHIGFNKYANLHGKQ